MKYCPYCGAALVDGSASFCAECGKSVSLMDGDRKTVTKSEGGKEPRHKKMKKKKPKKEKKKKPKKAPEKDEVLEEIVGEPVDDGYDGYYNDVLPPDMDRVKEGLDKDLIKKVSALAIGVIFIISMCVVMLYML